MNAFTRWYSSQTFRVPAYGEPLEIDQPKAELARRAFLAGMQYVHSLHNLLDEDDLVLIDKEIHEISAEVKK